MISSFLSWGSWHLRMHGIFPIALEKSSESNVPIVFLHSGYYIYVPSPQYLVSQAKQILQIYKSHIFDLEKVKGSQLHKVSTRKDVDSHWLQS